MGPVRILLELFIPFSNTKGNNKIPASSLFHEYLEHIPVSWQGNQASCIVAAMAGAYTDSIKCRSEPLYTKVVEVLN